MVVDEVLSITQRICRKMVASFKRHFAAEKHTLEYCLSTYPLTWEHANNLIKEIGQYFEFKNDSKILEIGAAQGKLVAAFGSLGYSCQGLEPYEPAIDVSRELSKALCIEINVSEGAAENIPYDNNMFDFVIAESVMEHVKDVDRVFKEVFRVLRPFGAFYFDTTSSVCPRQNEIRFFPFFPWFPKRVKIKIMDWAVRNRPSLVGCTETPAINWFSPWTTRKVLRQAGFVNVYDRWDILSGTSYGFLKKIMLRVIKLNTLTKLLADLIVPGCAYLAMKN